MRTYFPVDTKSRAYSGFAGATAPGGCWVFGPCLLVGEITAVGCGVDYRICCFWRYVEASPLFAGLFDI
jgi:hypothetical protein